MTTATRTARIFRVTLEVANLEAATEFYAALLANAGQRHRGSRHYFDCGGVTLAILDPTPGGLAPHPAPKGLSFAVADLGAHHERAHSLDALAPFKVHGEDAGAIAERPWGERSFYAVDPWGNELCFVDETTLYT